MTIHGRRRRGGSTPPFAPFLLAAAAAAGCGGAPVRDPARTIPSSVVVREARSGDGGAAPLKAHRLVREVAQALEAAAVFSEASADGEDERVGRGGPDYVCEIEVRGNGFRVEGSEANPKAVATTALWFFTTPTPLVISSWWIQDRSYPESDVEVRARFFTAGPGPSGKPVLTEVFMTRDLELGLWQRGAWWHFVLSFVLPSFWMEDAQKAEEALGRAAVERTSRELAERARQEWPAAALQGEPACILVLDPPAALLDRAGGQVDLTGWLASRAPLIEVRVLDDGGKVVSRLERKALSPLSLPRSGGGEEAGRAWSAVEARLGPTAGPPKEVYRIDLPGLEAGSSSRIRIQAWTAPDAPPARFTIPLAPSAEPEEGKLSRATAR